MKHRVKVYRTRSMLKLWYVTCSCSWQPNSQAPSGRRGGRMVFGRDTWDAAFALAVAHLRDKDCKHGA